jgi:hypothetical protein
MEYLTVEMNHYRHQRGIKYVISTSFSMPIYLRIQAKHYYYSITQNVFSDMNHRERRVVASVIDKWNKDQSSSIRHSTVSYHMNGDSPATFDYLSSSMIFMVELFEDEIESVEKDFNSNRNEFAEKFMQANLEYFFYNYNIAAEGEHIVNPTIYDCTPISTFICKAAQNEPNAISSSAVIYNGVGTYMKISNNQQFENELVSSDHNVGRYFYSEAKYSNLIGDHFKCIVYSAISVESIIMDVILSNSLEEEGYLKNEKGYFIGMYKKLNLLVDNDFIKVPNKIEFVDSIQMLFDNRHEIMHGNLQGLLNMKEVSDQNFNILENYYNVLCDAVNRE